MDSTSQQCSRQTSSPQVKKFIVILAIFGLIMPVLALAQDDTNTNVNTDVTETEEEVTADDLDVSEPKVLPNSPWYWVKSLWRSVKLFVTLDPVKKAEKRLEIANERLIELQAMVEQGEIPEERLEKILSKYDKEIEKLKNRVEKFEEKSKEAADKFLDKFTRQEFIRQRLLDKLEDKLKSEQFKRFKERTLEKFGEILNTIDEESIEEKITNALAGEDPLGIKHLKNLHILERLKEKVPEEAQAAIIRAQSNALKRLGEEFRSMTFDERVEQVKGFLEGDDDTTTTEVILEQVQEESVGSLPVLTNVLNRARAEARQKSNKNHDDDDDDDDDEEENEEPESGDDDSESLE